MSIRYNTGDFGLDPIMTPLARAYNGKDIKAYYVYGISGDTWKPHMKLRVSNLSVDPRPLVEFFQGMGLGVEVGGPRSGLNGAPGVSIGLRRDVRRNEELSKSLIRIVVHFIEGKLEGDLQPTGKRFELGAYEPRQRPERTELPECEFCGERGCDGSCDSDEDGSSS